MDILGFYFLGLAKSYVTLKPYVKFDLNCDLKKIKSPYRTTCLPCLRRLKKNYPTEPHVSQYNNKFECLIAHIEKCDAFLYDQVILHVDTFLLISKLNSLLPLLLEFE